jgi:tRNA dimethylallyltransferase
MTATPNHSQKKVVALIGTTASGKTDLALSVAKKTGAHIISCDSLLVYKGFDIGTAKPTAEEQKLIPHHGLDLVQANEPYTAVDWVRDMRPIIDDLWAKNIPILICGGTGFYLKALLFGVWDAPSTQPDFRARLEAEFEGFPAEQKALRLFKRLQEKDPVYAAKIKPQDTYRVIRALEIIETTGEKVSDRLQQSSLKNALPYPSVVYGIRRGSRDLERRIFERTNKMFSMGLVNETKELLRQYPDAPKPLRSVGYAEVLDFFAEKYALPECRERVAIATRQLAKKQRTFFKTFPGIYWYDLPGQEHELEAHLLGALQA